MKNAVTSLIFATSSLLTAQLQRAPSPVPLQAVLGSLCSPTHSPDSLSGQKICSHPVGMKIKDVPGFEICIHQNGSALQEYSNEDTENEERNLQSVRYVEATPGSNFAISFRAEPWKITKIVDSHMRYKICLDGKSVAKKVCGISRSQATYHEAVGRDYSLRGQKMHQKFRFGDLATNDGPAGDVTRGDVEYLGEIKVELIWGRKLGTKNAEQEALATVGPIQSIPEKCLKGRAISSMASLGEGEAIGGVYRCADTMYPHGKVPIATYVFKYRTRKDLQIEGVIERTPEPVPLEDREVDDLTHEEALELLRRQRLRGQQRQIEIKKEKRDHDTANADDDDEGEIEFTEPRPSKRLNTSYDSGIEIVDLTDV